jgi:hypothetical protein
MLTIYTSSESKALENIKVDYEFPENSISPWEQFEWMDAHLDEFEKETVSIKTFSPYILNYLNLMIIRSVLDYSRLDVFDAVLDEESGEVDLCDLKIQNDDVKLIDATLLSDPISHIYDEYNKIKESKEEK